MTSKPDPTVDYSPEYSQQQTAIVKADAKPAEVQQFELHQRMARLFATSGLFSDIRGVNAEQATAQAFVKIALGQSMGFTPAESMTGIDVIQGRIAVGANLRAARMQRAGYGWDILQLDQGGCTLRIKFKGNVISTEVMDNETGELIKVPAIVSFTAEDAKRANLDGKDNYTKYPPDMYFARAITRAQRWYAPGVLSLDVLSSEEIQDANIQLPGADPIVASKAKALLEEVKEKYRKKVEPETTTEAAPEADKPVVSQAKQAQEKLEDKRKQTTIKNPKATKEIIPGLGLPMEEKW